MTHIGTKTLDTPRLLLREFARDDAGAAFRNWTSDARVTKYLRWPAHTDVGVTESVISDWVNGYSAPDFYQWAIVPKYLGEPVGTIGVAELDEAVNKVHIGYALGIAWQRRGYMSEAFARVVDFLFREVGVNRIESQCDPENVGSSGVMKKCGLRYEGTLRRADVSNRGIVDAEMYAILAEDYFNGRGNV